MQNNQDLAEEIFCLKYEIDTLAEMILRKSSERWVPGFINEITEVSHLERYQLACKYTVNKNVADIACGIGKGSNMMSNIGKAQHILGMDIQPEAIRYARWRNKESQITFEIADVQRLEIYNKYDLAVSFETIEHLPDYKSFLKGVTCLLKKDGYVLVSTPISAVDEDKSPDNPHHIQEWGFHKFQEIISEYFVIEKIFVQLYPKKIDYHQQKPTLSERVIKKIKQIIHRKDVEKKISNSEINPSIFSKIEEFTGQYPVDDLGSTRLGYQILLAKVMK